MERIAFTIGSLTITWYGILVVTGFAVGLWTASRRGLRDGLPPELIADLGVWLMVGGIAGARLWYVLAYWHQDFAGQSPWEVVAVYHGGLVFFGGLLGASLATVFYARAHRVSLWRLADVLAPSIPLGQALGRIGCLMNGCCYGTPTTLPWAVHYPQGHPMSGAPVHPTQAYESGLDVLLFLGLACQFRRKSFTGQTFALYMVLYGVLRFAVEFLRGDYPTRYLGGWATPGQLASMVAVAGGLFLWWWRRGASAGAQPAKPRPLDA